MQEQKCEACTQLEADLISIHNRVQALEHSCNRMREAFVSNDLNLPDYDGHRAAHKTMIEQSQVVDEYKKDATKKIIDWIIGAAMALIGLGFIEWIKTHIKL